VLSGKPYQFFPLKNGGIYRIIRVRISQIIKHVSAMDKHHSSHNARKLRIETLERRELLSINTLPVPPYSSLPESSYTILLDFNGDDAKSDLQADRGKPAAFDLDGNSDAFSDLELKAIHDIWAYVSELYSPFNVNVTTVDPGSAGLNRTAVGDKEYGIRLCFGPIGGSIGLSFTGTFNNDYQSTDAMVDAAKIYNSTKADWNTFITGVGGTVAHEVGHTLGLNHQGTENSEYYGGHYINSSGDYWNAIMGLGTYKKHAFLQWSCGNYAGANKTEDNLQVITSNGFGYRPDEGTRSLTFSNGAAAATGIIATTGDADDFTFTVSTPAYYSFDAVSGINIDGQQFSSLYYTLDLYSGSQYLAHYVSSLDTLSVSTDPLLLSAGTYTLRIAGSGYEGLDGYQGFDNYGSLGTYSMTAASAALPKAGNLRSTSVSSSTVSLEWNVVAGATGYNVQYKKKADSTWTKATASPLSPATLTINALTSLTDYDFRVQAVNGSGTSGWTEYSVKTFGALPTPQNIRCTSHTNTSYSFAWDAVSGASYTVEYYNGSSWSFFTTPTGTSVNGTGDAGSTFTFRVRAKKDSTVSDWAYIDITLTNKPYPPPNFRSTAQTENSITLNWGTQSGLNGYTLWYKKTTETIWTQINSPDGTALTATVKGLTANTPYQFRLTAVNSSGFVGTAETMATTGTAAGVDTAKLAKPTGLTATVTGNGTKLTWNAVDGAAAYYIYRSADGGKTYIQVSTRLTKNFNGKTPYFDDVVEDGSYIYAVRAYDSSLSNVTRSDASTATLIVGKLAKPTNLTVTKPSTNGVKLTWDAVPGAAAYSIYRSADGGKTYTLVSTRLTKNFSGKTPYFDDTAVESGSYIYAVRAYDSTLSNAVRSDAVTVNATVAGR
jgi:hypothetical protein